MEKPDGNLGVIDLNPRVYGSLELAVHAGASLPVIWCDSLLDDRVDSEVRDARAGVWYRWEDADVRYAWRRLRSGGIRDVAPVLRPHRGTAHALFRLSDPGPLLARVISAVSADVEADGRSRTRSRAPSTRLRPRGSRPTASTDSRPPFRARCRAQTPTEGSGPGAGSRLRPRIRGVSPDAEVAVMGPAPTASPARGS